MLRDLPHLSDSRILAGQDLADDAGVFRLTDDLALIQTVDFFTPVVDDPFTFGQIAAANALSDIYAMGGTPITALNVSVFPTGALDVEILSKILKGGYETAAEASVAIIGGHTVQGEEPMYGLAVSGTIHPDRIVKPSGGRAGDVLILTKPIGTGVISTAQKASRAAAEHESAAIGWMTRLNGPASATMLAADASCSTDVTGFGLLGHLSQMARASGVAAEVTASAVPLLPGAFEYARRGFVPAGGRTNEEFFASSMEFAEEVDEDIQVLFHDPQTSGGLLFAVSESRSSQVVEGTEGLDGSAWVIGRLMPGEPGHVSVR